MTGKQSQQDQSNPTFPESLLNKFPGCPRPWLLSSCFLARGKSHISLIVTAKFELPGEKKEGSEEADYLCVLKAPACWGSAYRWSKHCRELLHQFHICTAKPSRKHDDGCFAQIKPCWRRFKFGISHVKAADGYLFIQRSQPIPQQQIKNSWKLFILDHFTMHKCFFIFNIFHFFSPRVSISIYMRQLCTNVHVWQWSGGGWCVVFAVVCTCAPAEKQLGECVKLFCVAKITPGPYQLHRGA